MNADSSAGDGGRSTVLSEGGRRCSGSVLLKVIHGVSIFIAVRLQELGSHREAGMKQKPCKERPWMRPKGDSL